MNNLKDLKKFLGNIPGLCETINNLLRLKKGVVVYNPDDYDEECSIVGEYDTTEIPTGILKLDEKLKKIDKEKIDTSLKAELFGIYVALINAIKTDPYYVIKLFMFGLDLSDSEIEGLFSTRLISEDFPKFQYVRRIDNMINVFAHGLINNPSFEDLEFIKAIRLPKNIENEYGGIGFINKLESIGNDIIKKKKDCFTERIKTFEDFFKSKYEITDKNEMIMTIISLPIRYNHYKNNDDEKKLSFFEEYMAPLFWYCLDILLYKYKKALIEQYVPNLDIKKYLLDSEGFIETTIGYNLRILNQSIKTIYGDVYDKIKDEIDDREKKILSEIYLFCKLISRETNISDKELTLFCMNMTPVYTKANGEYWNKLEEGLPRNNSNFATFLLDDKALVIPERMKFKPKQKEDKKYKEEFAERHKKMILEAEENRIITGIEEGIKKGRINVKGPNKYGSCANSVRSVRPVRSVRTLHRRRSYAKKQKRSKRLKRSKRKSNKKIKKRAVSF
jgi:hypothetical protein